MTFAKVFVGGDVVNYHQEDGKVIDKDLEAIVQGADLSVCNFEAPVAGFGRPILKSGPHHCQLPNTVNGLKEQGFDVLLLANNHIMDYGHEGLEATIGRAKLSNIEILGAGLCSQAAYQPLIKDVEGLMVGMLNACEAQFGVLDYFQSEREAGYAWINHHSIDEQVLRLKQTCDYVIVFSHAGLEHYHIPQKEWRARYKHLCNLGADAIIGSHPHVPQGYEVHDGSVIFYSLGNFYFDSKNYIHKKDSSYSVVLKFGKTSRSIDFDVVHHYKDGGKTKLAPAVERVDVEELNEMLTPAKYQKLHDEMSSASYNSFIKNLRVSVANGWYTGDFSQNLKFLIKKYLLKRKAADKDTLQLHLLRNEAYYFAVRHALEMKYQGKEPHE